jgi:hypothetical protein
MHENDNRHAQRNRKIVGLSIISIIVLMHVLRIGKHLQGSLFLYYYSYASDVIITFGVYFLLGLTEFKMKFFPKMVCKSPCNNWINNTCRIITFFWNLCFGNYI